MKRNKNTHKDIEIGTLIENFTEKIDFVTEQVIAIKETQDLHSHKFEKIDQRLDRIEISLDGVETRLDSVETRIGGVENGLKDVKTGLDKVEGALDQKADKEEVKKLDRRVFALETRS